MFRNIWRKTNLHQSSMIVIIIWNSIQEEGRKGLFSYGGLLENVLENIIFGQVALYVGERYRKPLEGLPPLKRGAGSFTKHSHFSLEIKKKYNGWSFIKMDHTVVYHRFHISTYVQVHLIFVIWRKCKLLHLKEIFPFDLCFRTTVSLSDTGEAAQLLYGLLSFIPKKLSLETTHFFVPCVTVSLELWYYLFSSCATVSYSFPSSGTPWFDPWPATLQTWSVSIWTTLQMEAKNSYGNQMISFPSSAETVFPASCLICCLWEASYPTTNLVSQTNFKVLKNSQNLDLLGLKQLPRIHLLCSQNLEVDFALRHKRIDKSFL